MKVLRPFLLALCLVFSGTGLNTLLPSFRIGVLPAIFEFSLLVFRIGTLVCLQSAFAGIRIPGFALVS